MRTKLPKIRCLLMLAAVLFTSCSARRDSIPPPTSQLTAVRDIESRPVALIFVHGINGDTTTWRNTQTNAYWPELIMSDHAFDSCGIYVYEYPTSVVGGSLSMNELGGNFREHLQDRKLLDKKSSLFATVWAGWLCAILSCSMPKL